MSSIQWWKNGDHPDDDVEIYYDEAFTPHLPEGHVVGFYGGDEQPTDLCTLCRQPYQGHGYIEPDKSATGEGVMVHPGDIIDDVDGKYDVHREDPMQEAHAQMQATDDSTESDT